MSSPSRTTPADRKRRRVQRIAFGMLGTGLVILVLAGIAFRDPILEQWHLHRLDSTDEETVAAAVHALGDVGSQRSVPRLLELAQPDSPLLDESVQTLGRICPRLGRAARSPLLKGLVALVRGNDPTAVEVLLRLAPDTPDLYPIVFRALESSPPPAVRSSVPLRYQLQVWNITSGMTVASFPSRCASLVVAGWPESRAATAAFLSAKRLELASVFIPYLQTRFRAGLSPTDPETVSEILRHFGSPDHVMPHGGGEVWTYWKVEYDKIVAHHRVLLNRGRVTEFQYYPVGPKKVPVGLK